MPQNSTDLFSNQAVFKQARHIFTVSEITQDIKMILENTFSEVWVEGEVSNLRPSSSGHVYFSLKDKEAVLSGVIFSRTAAQIKFKLEDGLKVICFGKIDVYPPRGNYQLIIEKVEPKGIGALQLALEQLKTKLEKEGLFSPGHKRPLPYLPSRIGVVTSLSGAAIKDILKVLDRRFSDIRVVINPAKVQGDGAKDEISQAIEDFNLFNKGVALEERIEVLIVGRGGGSIEDLWAFNEEAVARAIFDSQIPVISAVGHERDVTIADLVADVRAATPSVAAELVVPEKEALREELADLNQGLFTAMRHILELLSQELASGVRKLALLNPAALLKQHQERIADLARQIYVRAGHFFKLREVAFKSAVEKLSSLSPLNILSRGYSITFKADGAIIKDSGSVKAGDRIRTRLDKGEIVSKVEEA
ncbi:MAG: exodeoxyribonuclease VII large subunit [Candidatus Omnitrophica bacterium]|nr:exodeoxyribonuclease VII large subunit [Candidatus Omnitrophota bacterium]